MNRVIDASVACGWFFEESLSDAARKVAESDTVFFAPDMILAECANVAWKKVRRKDIQEQQAVAFLQALPRWFESLVSSAQLHETAFEMACVLDHSVYDCLYLALAEDQKTRLITADIDFADQVRNSPWKDRIEVLHGS
ncbi:MAG: type II toxin-antitoxin system VapC family toxin [Gammaproteobacteria bacterium]|nr:type II toxin-antitoxin system VapC family toxin [Gammaproteobacteria bacterium]